VHRHSTSPAAYVKDFVSWQDGALIAYTRSMKAIITCVNYDDYLRVTLPTTSKHFQEVIVVTDTKDLAARSVAESNGAKVVATDAFYEKKASFNRGRALNEVFDQILDPSWLCLLDADILLPDDFKDKISKIKLQTDTIYGIPRLMCPSKREWENYLITSKTKGWFLYKACKFVVGKIYEKQVINHFVPSGYFQLFHTCALTSNPKYPDDYDDAGEADIRFAMQWYKNQCLDHIISIHLPLIGSNAEGINWKGRRTKRF
jgi:hypothetical protein